MNIRKKLEIEPGQKVKRIKPTHGPCCTCQTCGYGFDDCICWENEKIEICEYVEDGFSLEDTPQWGEYKLGEVL